MSGDDRQNSPSISRQNRPSATIIYAILQFFRKTILQIASYGILSEMRTNIPFALAPPDAAFKHSNLYFQGYMPSFSR